MYKPKLLEQWHELVNYSGDNFDDYYVANFRFFSASATERANFNYIWEHLEDCGAEPNHVLKVKFTDDVYLCRYYIFVHKDAEKALRMADMFLERIERKGSLDPEAEQAINLGSIQRKWASSGLGTKVDLCREAGMSIFASRRKLFPLGVDGSDELFEMLSEA